MLFFWAFLLAHQVYAAQLVKDGIGSCSTYADSVYRATNYRPFCGTLAPDSSLPWSDYKNTCNTALSVYRGSQDTFALYDTTGLRYPDAFPIGAGIDVCMCYSLSEVQPISGQPKKANFCTLVTASGAEKSSGTWAAGSYELGNKALPQCFEINISAVTSSLAVAASKEAATMSLPPGVTTAAAAPGSTQRATSGSCSQRQTSSWLLATGLCSSILFGIIGAGL